LPIYVPFISGSLRSIFFYVPFISSIWRFIFFVSFMGILGSIPDKLNYALGIPSIIGNIIVILFYFIIGALVGMLIRFIVGKIKSKNNKELVVENA